MASIRLIGSACQPRERRQFQPGILEVDPQLLIVGAQMPFKARARALQNAARRRCRDAESGAGGAAAHADSTAKIAAASAIATASTSFAAFLNPAPPGQPSRPRGPSPLIVVIAQSGPQARQHVKRVHRRQPIDLNRSQFLDDPALRPCEQIHLYGRIVALR